MGDKIRLKMTAKDTRLTFRIGAELKRKLECVAAAEGRSVSQVCDAFLQGGLIAYRKEGTRYFRRFLARRDEDSQEH